MSVRWRLPAQGLLVAICGLDGSGKTTQCKLLEQRLRPGYEVHRTRSVSERLRNDRVARSFLDRNSLHKEMIDVVPELALLTAADRMTLMRTEILPRLESGEVVILDRYVFGSYAQTLARGLADIDWLMSINRYLPYPHIAFYLDVTPTVALNRVLSRGDRPRREELDHDLTSKMRQTLIDQPWGRVPNYYILDGHLRPNALAERIGELVSAALARRANTQPCYDADGIPDT